MKKRSKRYQELKNKIDKNKVYPLDEAIKLLKETSKAGFDASCEAHIRLGIDPEKSDQHIRGVVQLPHGTGKELKVAAFVLEDKIKETKAAGADLVGGEDLIEKIKKTGKCDFDVACAQPQLMKSLAQIARILGPRGLMPNPKTGTITQDPAKAVKELKSGKISFKSDPAGIIHLTFGKASFDDKKLKENLEALIVEVNKSRPESFKKMFIKNIVISSTMGPSLKVKI